MQTVASGAWCEMSWQITDLSTDIKKDERAVRIAVDGKPLMERGQLTGKLVDLRLEANDGEMVVGGVELIRGGGR